MIYFLNRNDEKWPYTRQIKIFGRNHYNYKCHIGKIFRNHRGIIDNDEQAKQILPDGAVRVSYKRSRNLKDLLAPSNPCKNREVTGGGCFLCTAKRCHCCKNFLIPAVSFRFTAPGRFYNICKSLTCTSQNVVYLAHCVACDLQGVGSTVNFESRLANYKSHIKYKKRTCIA